MTRSSKATDMEYDPLREEVCLIDIEKVSPNPNQPRKFFGPADMKELIDSIRMLFAEGKGLSGTGIEHPIIVRRKVGTSFTKGVVEHFEIIAGERRYRAAKEAGVRQLPCIIRDVDDETSFEMALIENVQRKDMLPLEEAQAFAYLAKVRNYSYRELAAITGKSKGYIENRMGLLAVKDKRLIELVSGESESMTLVLSVSKVKDKTKREELIQKAITATSPEKRVQVTAQASATLKQEATERKRSAEEKKGGKPVPFHHGTDRAMDAAINQLNDAINRAAGATLERGYWAKKLKDKDQKIRQMLDHLKKLSGG